MSYLILITTVPSIREGRKLAGILLKKKLAACIQISPPIESHYRWDGKNVKSREFQLLIKTQASLYAKAEALIVKNHSYDVPEVIAFPITRGSRNYLNWIRGEVSR